MSWSTPSYALLLLVVLGANYLYAWLSFRKVMLARARGGFVAPPVVPDFIPRISNSIQFVWNPTAFVSRIIHFASKEHQNAVRLDVGPKSLYVIQGADNIRGLWKRSSALSSSANLYWPLMTLFGLAEKLARNYLVEDSVVDGKDDPATSKHIGSISHHLIAGFLTGPGLSRLWGRYEKELGEHFAQASKQESSGWIEQDDFTDLFAIDFTKLSLRALVGPVLLQLDPDFPRRFQEYSYALPHLLRGEPRWWSPKPYQVRDSLVTSIKKWHEFARENFTPDSVAPDGDEDPYWGCAFFRKRQEVLGGIYEQDYDALASEDFGFIYGSHHNVTFASFWVAFEVYRNATLLARVRSEISASTSATSSTGFDVDKLCKSPLLQSIWAETMRLRVHIFNTRNTRNEEHNINNWIIPKNSTVFLTSTPAHMDESEWNTGENNEYPLDTFWAERFIKYPNNPHSGPMRKCATNSGADSEGQPYYYFDASMVGSWIPFGGGPYKCPGRHFAKREALMLCALLVSNFDIELIGDGDDVKMDWRTCGLGTLKPDRKIRYRIRKRSV
ncbi:cytochrome P450 [Lophiotrema nucula]|uniref:Cytochrome P450 n=1 Tax=Lophiotrema nucula TaxID=690887 RepID=A0A6A5ZRR2_9PLEO|nr:cytochrome P450 [Lophiotrema nucula]